MKDKAIKIPGAGLLVIGLAFTFLSPALIANPPDDNFYVGGPDGFSESKSLSETWHVIENELPPTPLPEEHPYKDHEDDDDDALVLMGKKFTVRRHGDQWYLIPDTTLGWTPAVIPLKGYLAFFPWGTADQWRWVNTPVVMIDGHAHDICIGYPKENTSRRDDDRFLISVVDRSNPPADPPDCKDPTEVHPGHSSVGR